MDIHQNVFNHLLNEIQFLREEVRMKNFIIKSQLISKSSKHNEKNVAHKTTDDNFLDENFVQLNIRSKNEIPIESSQGNDVRSDKIGLTHKISKENLSKVHNDYTADEKISNEYNDAELINFNLVSAATNVSNLFCINKNSSGACDITYAKKGKRLETVLVNSVSFSAPGNYNEVNLHLVETIASTINRFKALTKKARKLTEDDNFTVNGRAQSSLKNQQIKLKKLTHGRKALL